MKNKGDKLKDLRNIYALSQKEFSNKIGISKASLNAYENNINPLPLKVIWKIFDATGINPEYFETNIDINKALKKYHIDIKKGVKTLETKEKIYYLYDGIQNYINQAPKESRGVQDSFLNDLFFDMIDFEPHFVIVKTNEAEPFAKNGEILAIQRTNICENGRILIESQGKISIVYCGITPMGVTLIFNPNEKGERYTLKEFEKNFKVLGVVKFKYALSF